MKRQWISCLLLLACVAIGLAQQPVTDNGFGSLSTEDQQLVDKLIELVDEGMMEAIIIQGKLVTNKQFSQAPAE